jgi:hypothetical protein
MVYNETCVSLREYFQRIFQASFSMDDQQKGQWAYEFATDGSCIPVKCTSEVETGHLYISNGNKSPTITALEIFSHQYDNVWISEL